MDRTPPPPPPPPPHSEKPNTTQGEYRKATDLPEGNYDIFIIPPHSAGSGFLYLPSLQCHRNSFIAGAFTTLVVVLLFQMLSPIARAWYTTAIVGGNGVMGVILLVGGALLAGWAFGTAQGDQGPFKGATGGQRGRGFGSGSGGAAEAPNQSSSSGESYSTGPTGSKGARGAGTQNFGGQFGGAGSPPPQEHSTPNHEWDRAREETKRKEEIRRKMEEFKKKREAEQKEKKKQREREAMEKELRERREELEKEIAAAKEAAAKEAREKAEKEAAEAKAKADREAAEKEATAKEAAKKEADARFAALKEAAAKRYAEKKAKDAGATTDSTAKPSSPRPASATSPKKPPPFPTARTATNEDDDAYSFRPYDRPRRPYGASAASVDSESSYAPSQSTARTTPPPSSRGPYATKDPDKIVIRGVFAFNNAFPKTPIAQLVSGKGMVTDGLILRITTEGLFIDDDVRGVPQREWDVKAWTMKMVEVWCSQFATKSPHPTTPGKSSSNIFRRITTSQTTIPTGEESDAYLADLLKVCKNTCRLASSPDAHFIQKVSSSTVTDEDHVWLQSAELRGLHVVRASVRDQEGKRYVFVLPETEGWKVAIGLQRLRKGSQVRALGATSMPVNDCRAILANLGFI